MTTETQCAYMAACAKTERIATARDAAIEEWATLRRLVKRADERVSELNTALEMAIDARTAAALEVNKS